MTHIHVNKELTDDLESQGYHLVDKHQLAKMQQLEKVAKAARAFVEDHPPRDGVCSYDRLQAALEAIK